jgi:hypothetical protein
MGMKLIRQNLSTVVIATVVSGIVAAGPVIAHGVQHALFAHNAGKLDGIDSPGFVRSSGNVLVTSFGPWITHVSTLNMDVQSSNWTVVKSSATGNSKTIQLRPDLPTVQSGKSLKLKGVEICYNAVSTDVALSRVSLTRLRNTVSAVSNATPVVDDTTDRNDATCRLLTGTPVELTAEDGAVLVLTLDFTGTVGNFTVSRTTFVLKATKTTAAPPS